MNFTKMHGLGNDYVFVNCFREKITEPSELAKRINLRNTPELIFEIDDSMEYGAKIDSILKEIMPNK